MSSKYDAPPGPPPTYGQSSHQPAQPQPTYQEPASASYYQADAPGAQPDFTDPRGMAPQQGGGGGGYYGSPMPPQQQQQYGSPYPPQQGGYAPPQQGGYYQQQQPGPMYAQQPPMGYYQQPQKSSSGEGICAGIMGALACCCCLDLLF